MTNHLLKLVEHTLFCRVDIRRGHRIAFTEFFALFCGQSGWEGQAITVVLIRAREAGAVLPILAVESEEMTVLGIAVLLVSAVRVSGLSPTQDKQQAEDQQGRGHGGVVWCGVLHILAGH